LDEFVGRVRHLGAQVSQREAEQGAAAPFDRPAEQRVFDRGQVTTEHSGDQLHGEALAGEQ